MSHIKIKRRKPVPKLDVVMINGEPRILLSSLARALGITDEEAERLLLEHIDELNQHGPVLAMDEAGNFRPVEKTARA